MRWIETPVCSEPLVAYPSLAWCLERKIPVGRRPFSEAGRRRSSFSGDEEQSPPPYPAQGPVRPRTHLHQMHKSGKVPLMIKAVWKRAARGSALICLPLGASFWLCMPLLHVGHHQWFAGITVGVDQLLCLLWCSHNQTWFGVFIQIWLFSQKRSRMLWILALYCKRSSVHENGLNVFYVAITYVSIFDLISVLA